jgi:hypothetical protein
VQELAASNEFYSLIAWQAKNGTDEPWCGDCEQRDTENKDESWE